jgi:hypothetical protein
MISEFIKIIMKHDYNIIIVVVVINLQFHENQYGIYGRQVALGQVFAAWFAVFLCVITPIQHNNLYATDVT